MAITLVTGVPGSGKTAWVVDHIIGYEGKRPIIVDGIPELQLDADPAPPVREWTEKVPDESSQTGEKLQFSFQTGSLVVIDECQRVFPRRAVGKAVPDYVAAFETHRHRGLDFILITQHPRLLDSHVRSLVAKHIHIRVTWQGRHKYEWSEVGDPESKSSRDLAARDRYKLPKRVFARYKSAEAHTKLKQKVPMYAYVLGAALLGFVYMGSQVYTVFKSKFAPENPQVVLGQPESVKVSSPGGTMANGLPKVSAAEYHEQFVPRVPGLHHTAPAYDQITQAVDAPIPVACIQNHAKNSCRCMDQQGNNYATSPVVCQSFVKNGMFIPWRNVQQESKDKTIDEPEKRQKPADVALPSPPSQNAPV